MFEFDAAKLVIIGIVALVFIGPKELPRVMRQVGQAIAKIRRLGGEFQSQFMDAIREADLEEIKLEAAKISEAAKLDAGMDPLAGIRAELTKTMEETSEGTSAASAATSFEGHSEPLVEALHDNPEAAIEIVEHRILPVEPLAEPLAVNSPISTPEEPPSEPGLVPEPLHKRA